MIAPSFQPLHPSCHFIHLATESNAMLRYTALVLSATITLLLLPLTGMAMELIKGGDFTQEIDPILSAWQVKPDERSRITQNTENQTSYITLTSSAPESTLMRQTIAVPPGTKTLHLHIKARISGVIRGEKWYCVPRLAIQWVGDKEHSKQFVIDYRKDSDWNEQHHTIAVPDEFTSFELVLGTPKGTGVMDVAKLSLQTE